MDDDELIAAVAAGDDTAAAIAVTTHGPFGDVERAAGRLAGPVPAPATSPDVPLGTCYCGSA